MNRMKIAFLAAGVAILGGAGFLLNGLPTVAHAADMTVYKSDSCGCCGGWVEHMRKAGYAIRVVPTDDLARSRSASACRSRCGPVIRRSSTAR
jgi:hypothetical protein